MNELMNNPHPRLDSRHKRIVIERQLRFVIANAFESQVFYDRPKMKSIRGWLQDSNLFNMLGEFQRHLQHEITY